MTDFRGTRSGRLAGALGALLKAVPRGRLAWRGADDAVFAGAQREVDGYLAILPRGTAVAPMEPERFAESMSRLWSVCRVLAEMPLDLMLGTAMDAQRGARAVELGLSVEQRFLLARDAELLAEAWEFSQAVRGVSRRVGLAPGAPKGETVQ